MSFCSNSLSYFIFKIIIISICYASHLVKRIESFECGKSFEGVSFGVISSPGYADGSLSVSNCTWYIIGQPNDVITIQIADVNLDDSSHDCRYSWIELGPAADRKSKRYCRPGYIPPSFVSSKYRVWITYHLSPQAKAGSGFRLVYSVEPKKSESCKKNQFHCKSGKCIPKQWTCNGRFECEDGSDEVDCENFCIGNKLHCGNNKQCFNQVTQQCNGYWDCPDGADELGCASCESNEYLCKSRTGCYDLHKRCDNVKNCLDLSDELGCGECQWNEAQCTLSGGGCYDPIKDKCDGKFDCLKGEDEVNCNSLCPNLINCTSVKGCYSPTQRCNSIANCADSSDEKNCSQEVCKSEIGGFLCDNKLCIRESWMCDQTNDCGDFSDEEGCIKNSVITAAVMGALICGLLLVIAVGCTCKLYTLRLVEQQDLRYETPMSQIERELMQREPPPPYAIAVGGVPFCNHDQYSDHFLISLPMRSGRTRSGRRSRHHSRRRRAPSPPPLVINTAVSPDTSSTSIQISDDESTETILPVVNNSSNSSNNESTGNPNKVSKPVSSALYPLNSQSIDQGGDKSDSSCEDPANGSNATLDNQIQLNTISAQSSLEEEDFITDDMQSLCAS